MSGDNGDLLSASRSPQTVKLAGVRRLNHIPLYIVGGILLIVVLLIVWTASERAKTAVQKDLDHGGSAQDFAVAVAGDYPVRPSADLRGVATDHLSGWVRVGHRCDARHRRGG
jgi:hypothetical protein